jgi:hypothetical protein
MSQYNFTTFEKLLRLTAATLTSVYLNYKGMSHLKKNIFSGNICPTSQEISTIYENLYFIIICKVTLTELHPMPDEALYNIILFYQDVTQYCTSLCSTDFQNKHRLSDFQNNIRNIFNIFHFCYILAAHPTLFDYFNNIC